MASLIQGKFNNIVGNQAFPGMPFSGVLRGGPLVAGVEVTCLISENHTLSAQVTQQALESGAIVSDHVIIEPYTVSCTFEVSNAGLGPMIAKDVYGTFKNMLEQRQPVTLMTEFNVYQNMVLTSMTPVHEAPFKGRLYCTVTLQQVNFVKVETVGKEETQLEPASGQDGRTGATNKTASAEVEGGTQNPKDIKSGSAIYKGIAGKSDKAATQ